ncbi:probable serine/threonine-protein kinase nek3 [Anopheles merus]|uniref:probable serine/threonine-protein kinase nek3 n=1 Tax=Anopheles merus TaxID=30066 RepID=UPI001BE3F04E|nr:probable serine/threonine-protein kinase nek3 [Anopheles merus]
MREVDTSETSVVWPAWCYSGETTVNEDLPQRLVAAAAAAAAATAVTPSPIVLLAQQEERQRQNSRHQKDHQHHHQHHQQQASSNQSRSSSASSASVSSSPSSPATSPHSRSATLSQQERRRVKRKSITSTLLFNQSPVAGLASSAIAAALEAGSVVVPASPPGGLLGLSPHRRVAEALYDGRPFVGGNGAPLLSIHHDRNIENRQNEATSDEEEDQEEEHEDNARAKVKANRVKSNHFGVINTRLLQERVQERQTKLHTLDKMLSERIYDRKKYLNSPTGSGGASTVGSSTAASAFYEKYRNGGDSGESQLNLIKNGATSGGSIGSLNGVSSSAHLSAIAASIIGSSNGSNNGSNTSNNNEGNGTLSLHSGGNSNSNQISSNKNGNGGNNNNNNNSNTNNNNISSGSIGSINNSNTSSIKSERFSPPNNDAQSMASRSRSVTPSSFSGTPPQTMHASDVGFSSSISTGGLLPSPNSSSGAGNSVGRSEFQTRNYSDFMRSLAAKYNNNNNTNDISNIKNSFLEPKMRLTQPKSYIESSLSSKKGSPLTSTQVPNPSIMTSLFSSLPFQSAVFPPLIDMSSTQALVTLARAAKDSEVHNILKVDTGGGLKKPSSLSRGSSPPPSSALGSHHFSSPFGTGYLPGLLPNHHHLASFPSQSPSLATSGPLKSPSRAPEPTTLVSTFPLDLSATTPSGSKRIKLSPTPSRHQETSPAPSSTNSQPSADSLDLKSTRKCHARVEEISAWTVDNVCDFVASIDICAEYVQNFRDQSIDGAGLPLLTEEHLTNSLGMKLGPALKLRSMLAKKLGGPCPCALCSVPTSMPPARTNSSGSGSSKGDTTPTNRPPSNDGSIG